MAEERAVSTGGLRRAQREHAPASGLPAAPPVQSAKSRTRRVGGGWPVWAGAVAAVLGITVITAAALTPKVVDDSPIQIVAAAVQEPGATTAPSIPCPAFAGGESSNTRSEVCGRMTETAETNSQPDAETDVQTIVDRLTDALISTGTASDTADPGPVVRATASPQSSDNSGTGTSTPGKTSPGTNVIDKGNSGTGNSGTGNSGTGNSGTGNSGTGNSGTGNSGTGNSGTGNSGTGNSGTGNSGTGTTPTKPPTTTTPTTPPATTTPTAPPSTTPTTPPTTTPTTPPTTSEPEEPTPTTPPETSEPEEPEPATPAGLAFTGATKKSSLLGLITSYTVSISGEPGSTATVKSGVLTAGTVTFDANGNASITLGTSLLGLGNPTITVTYSDGTAGGSISKSLKSI